jgi:hypothetical protein
MPSGKPGLARKNATKYGRAREGRGEEEKRREKG